jgi:hypothetical protein
MFRLPDMYILGMPFPRNSFKIVFVIITKLNLGYLLIGIGVFTRCNQLFRYISFLAGFCKAGFRIYTYIKRLLLSKESAVHPPVFAFFLNMQKQAATV